MANLSIQSKQMKSSRQEISAQRIQTEDSLKHLLDCQESQRSATMESLAGILNCTLSDAAKQLAYLRQHNLAFIEETSYHLTPEGYTYALQIVRSHRLYETWLARNTHTPAEDWHHKANIAEHFITPEEANQLSNTLNNPRFDPHGDPIPTRDGTIPKRSIAPLTSWPSDSPAKIAHIEDEPARLFKMTQALALAPGTRIQKLNHLSDGSIEAWIEGRIITIPTILTPLIHVSSCDESEAEEVQRLSDLSIGQSAKILTLSPACVGPERRRLLDLGFVPKSLITCVFTSPFQSPRCYEIRGALIALRTEQADRILIHPNSLIDP